MTGTKRAELLAREASRYLAVVDAFAGLDADPHAQARAHAARARSREDHGTTARQRKGVRGWRR
jgi:hypothetical protein